MANQRSGCYLLGGQVQVNHQKRKAQKRKRQYLLLKAAVEPITGPVSWALIREIEKMIRREQRLQSGLKF